MTIAIDFDLCIDIVEMPLHLMPAEEHEFFFEDDDNMTVSSSGSGCSLSDCSSLYYDDDDDILFSPFADDDDELDEELPPLVVSREHSSALFRAERLQHDRRTASSSSSSSSARTRDTDSDSIVLANRRGVRRPIERQDSLILARGRIAPHQSDNEVRNDDDADALYSYVIPLALDDDDEDDDEEIIIPLYDEKVNSSGGQGNRTLRRRSSFTPDVFTGSRGCSSE